MIRVNYYDNPCISWRNKQEPSTLHNPPISRAIIVAGRMMGVGGALTLQGLALIGQWDARGAIDQGAC